MTKKPKALKFEQAMSQLEKMVQKLEEGDLSLEESLRFFEEGIGLTKFCEEKLAEAEGKVEMLMKDKSGKKIAKKVKQVEEVETDDSES